MKLFRLFGMVAFSGLLMTGFASCGSDEPGNDEGDDPVVEPGQVDETVNRQLTSAEAGNYLDETATKISEMFDPADQKEVIDVFQNFVDRYGYYEFDEDYFNFETGGRSMLAEMAKSFVIGLSTGDPGSLSRAANTFVTRYEISFDKLKGVYTPDTRNQVWKRDPSGNDIVFRFGTTEFKVQVSGGNWDIEFADSYDDWWDDATYVEEYKVTVPKNIVMTVTDSGKELVKSVVETNLDINGHNFHVKTSLRAANITLDALVDGNNNLISESQSMTVGGQRFLTTVTSVNGSHLCDMEYLSEIFDEDVESAVSKIDNTFGKGVTSVNICDRVQIKAEISKIGTLMAAGSYDSYTYYNKNAENDAVKFASSLNNNVKAQMYFGNTSVAQADMQWQKCYYEYYAGVGDWYVEPVIVFGDGSRFTFEEYFDESRFANAENKFLSLVYLYESLW